MSLTFVAFWFYVLSASEPQIQFHGKLIVTPLSRMTRLVLQISTPPVQFDIVIFLHVLELRSQYVLSTHLTTRPSRFAAFWSHVLDFACVFSFWLSLSIMKFKSCQWRWNCCRVAFWARFGYVLTTFWSLASVSVLISPSFVWIVPKTHPHPRSSSISRTPSWLGSLGFLECESGQLRLSNWRYVLDTYQIAVSWCLSGVEFRV